MGRRSRKRGATAPLPAPAPPRDREPAHRAAAAGERPRAPWHPFPLVELCVFIGLVLLVWGLFTADEASGRVLLVCGMALGSLGGLDTALREHLAGYRSHTTVIAALPAVTTAALLFFARVPWIVLILGAVAVFVAGVLFFARAPWIVIPVAAGAVLALGFVLLRRAFRARH